MASKEYIGLARLTQAFQLLKAKLDLKTDKTDTAVMTQAEATTGTSTTGRTISAKVLNDTILAKGGGSSGTDISEVNYNNLPAADKTNGSTYYVY